jgi:hypothetical protein
MSQMFKMEIGFVDQSPKDPGVIFVGGRMLEGDLRKGSIGIVRISDAKVRLRVMDVGFLERAAADAIFFSAERPKNSPCLTKWVGGILEG